MAPVKAIFLFMAIFTPNFPIWSELFGKCLQKSAAKPYLCRPNFG